MANEPHNQSEGRRKNAAQPLDAAKDNAGADRYPDSDGSSSEPKVRNETAPSQGGQAADSAGAKRD